MAQMFKRAANKIIESNLIIPLTLVFITMFIVSCGLFIEDYSTSLLGYKEFPTAKANDWIIYFVALIPQLSQIGFGYVYLDDTNKKWAFIIVILSHIVDIATDIWFKINGVPAYVRINGFDIPTILIAFVEAETLYTVGSEFMLTTSIGMLARLLPPFLDKTHDISTQFMKVFNKYTKGTKLEDVMIWLGFVEKDNKKDKPDDSESFEKPKGRPRKEQSFPDEIVNMRRPMPEPKKPDVKPEPRNYEPPKSNDARQRYEEQQRQARLKNGG